MIENVSTQLTVFHCFAHCLLPGRAFASLYVLLFLEKEAEIGGRVGAPTTYVLVEKQETIFSPLRTLIWGACIYIAIDTQLTNQNICLTVYSHLYLFHYVHIMK